MSDKQKVPSALRGLLDESQRTINDLKAGRISEKEAKLRQKEIKERIKAVESSLRDGGRIVP